MSAQKVKEKEPLFQGDWTAERKLLCERPSGVCAETAHDLGSPLSTAQLSSKQTPYEAAGLAALARLAPGFEFRKRMMNRFHPLDSTHSMHTYLHW